MIGKKNLVACGHEIVKAFIGHNRSKHVIIAHPDGTYTVGLFFDSKDRSWGRGRYGYSTLADAIDYLQTSRYVVETSIDGVIE